MIITKETIDLSCYKINEVKNLLILSVNDASACPIFLTSTDLASAACFFYFRRHFSCFSFIKPF